jgi:signal transduction histidine kinase
LVTKELVNNAIKYSEAKNISINSTFKKGEVNFTVQDDGIGFDNGKIYSGNGLKNIKSRIQELGGILHINSVPGKGSSFTYFIPLHTTT